jgi:hypothetical protein
LVSANVITVMAQDKFNLYTENVFGHSVTLQKLLKELWIVIQGMDGWWLNINTQWRITKWRSRALSYVSDHVQALGSHLGQLNFWAGFESVPRKLKETRYLCYEPLGHKWVYMWGKETATCSGSKTISGTLGGVVKRSHLRKKYVRLFRWLQLLQF